MRRRILPTPQPPDEPTMVWSAENDGALVEVDISDTPPAVFMADRMTKALEAKANLFTATGADLDVLAELYGVDR